MFVKDTIDLPEDFKFNMFITSGEDYNSQALHIHDCLEINYVLEGTGINIIGDKEYSMKKDDIYIINNLEYHKAFSNRSLKLLVIVFDQCLLSSFDFDFIKAFYQKQMIFSNLITMKDHYHHALKILFYEMKDEWDKKQTSYKLFIKSCLFKTLAILNRHFINSTMTSTDNLSINPYSPINKVIEYIKFNFKEDLTLTDLAKLTNLNKSYLSTLFRKTTNMPLFKYLRETRLWYANYLIMNTSLNITEIASCSGFKNLSHFVKCYREKYNVTPLTKKTKRTKRDGSL